MKKTITNVSRTPLRLPRGPVINPGASVEVDDWEKKESNTVVQAWIKSKALVLGKDDEAAAAVASSVDATTTMVPQSPPPTPEQTAPQQGGNPWEAGGNQQQGQATNDAVALDEMTKQELRDYIESKGGKVEGDPNKAELLEQAKKA